MRAYDTPNGTAIFRHGDHIDRLFQSAALYHMEIPFSKDEIRAATFETITRNELKSCYIRPLVFRGAGPMGLYPLDCPVEVMIAVWEWGAYLGEEGKISGVRAKVSSWRKLPSDCFIPTAKAGGQYLNSILAKIESDKAGYEEAILLDNRGFVAEGTGENLFVIKGGRISTPGFGNDILGGINRLAAMEIARDLGYEVVERDIARGELYTADEIFMTGTAAELTPIREIDDLASAPARAATSRTRSRRSSRTRCTAARSATRSGWTSCPPRSTEMSDAVVVYDTTLRDGMQGEGMSLSVGEKVRVAKILDELGVPMIEAGFPTSNPKELELFELLRDAGLSGRCLCVRNDAPPRRRRRRGRGLRVLAESWTPVSTIVGKTWGLHLEKVVKVDREENLRMIHESVAFLVNAGKRVIYDAEHFFDGYRDDAAYAIECLRAAEEAGAVNLTMCDTNGASLPHEVAEAVHIVRRALPAASLGIHTHNDAEVAVANSLAAIAEGCRLVQGTMNGYGERCGNANLISIIPNLQLKLGYQCLPSLEGLTEASHMVADMLNLQPDANQAYVGRNAFAHKGGMHVAGVNADPATFEHIDPATVGNSRDVLVSELSGKGTVIAHAGGDLDDATAARVVERVKELEHRGFQFEAADGSFDLLIRRETGEYEPLFRLESWRVMAEKREDGRVETEATIKLWVDGQRYVRTAEGNGPVHALDRALREAIGERFPHLREIKLVNFKVRILDEWKAAGATTRVLLDASDGTSTWGAIGVHENVIEASWDALVDSLEAGMLRSKVSR